MRLHNVIPPVIFIIAIFLATSVCPVLASETDGADIKKAVAGLYPMIEAKHVDHPPIGFGLLA